MCMQSVRHESMPRAHAGGKCLSGGGLPRRERDAVGRASQPLLTLVPPAIVLPVYKQSGWTMCRLFASADCAASSANL